MTEVDSIAVKFRMMVAAHDSRDDWVVGDIVDEGSDGLLMACLDFIYLMAVF